LTAAGLLAGLAGAALTAAALTAAALSTRLAAALTAPSAFLSIR
jgi:hypothetical protein